MGLCLARKQATGKFLVVKVNGKYVLIPKSAIEYGTMNENASNHQHEAGSKFVNKTATPPPHKPPRSKPICAPSERDGGKIEAPVKIEAPRNRGQLTPSSARKVRWRDMSAFNNNNCAQPDASNSSSVSRESGGLQRMHGHEETRPRTKHNYSRGRPAIRSEDRESLLDEIARRAAMYQAQQCTCRKLKNSTTQGSHAPTNFESNPASYDKNYRVPTTANHPPFSYSQEPPQRSHTNSHSKRESYPTYIDMNSSGTSKKYWPRKPDSCIQGRSEYYENSGISEDSFAKLNREIDSTINKLQTGLGRTDQYSSYDQDYNRYIGKHMDSL